MKTGDVRILSVQPAIRTAYSLAARSEGRRLPRDPILLAAPQALTALLLGVVFLMTTKPSLVGSIIVMAVVLVLGLAWGLLIARRGAHLGAARRDSGESPEEANRVTGLQSR